MKMKILLPVQILLVFCVFVSCSKQDFSTTALTATVGGARWTADSITVKDNLAAGFIITTPGPNGEQFWLKGFGSMKSDSIEIACENDQGKFTIGTANHISYTDQQGNVFYSIVGSGSISISRQFVARPIPDAGTLYNYSGSFNATLVCLQSNSEINISGTFTYKSHQ